MTLQTFGAKNLKLHYRARRDAPALMASHSQAQETQHGMENRMVPFLGKSGIARMLLEIRANLGSSCFVSAIMNGNPKRSKKTEKPKPKKQDDDDRNNHNSPSRLLRDRELLIVSNPSPLSLSLSLSLKNKIHRSKDAWKQRRCRAALTLFQHPRPALPSITTQRRERFAAATVEIWLR